MALMKEGEIQELSELLDTVSEKIPRLVKELLGSIYSPQAGADMGAAVGSFYKGLIDAGIPSEEAIAMAKEYMVSISSIMKDTVHINK